MSEFEKYVEMAGRQKQDKEVWWKNNFEALIEFADVEKDYAIEILCQDIEDDEEREEAMEAEQDSTAKHIAQGLLSILSIEDLEELIDEFLYPEDHEETED